MIDGNTPEEGENRENYCRRRWGGSGWAPKFKKWDWWPNTFNAHRLCAYLEEIDAMRSDLTERERSDRGHKLVKKFFELTYEEGENISTPRGAAKAIEELGFGSADDAVKWLEQGGGIAKVLDADSSAKRSADVTSVPHFVVSGSSGPRQVLVGSHPTDAFLNAFEQVTKQ